MLKSLILICLMTKCHVSPVWTTTSTIAGTQHQSYEVQAIKCMLYWIITQLTEKSYALKSPFVCCFLCLSVYLKYCW